MMNTVPGHVCVLQSRYITAAPGHVLPLRHRLVLDCLPPPQVSEHPLQLLHSDQLGTTGTQIG